MCGRFALRASAYFGKQLSERELNEMLKALIAGKIIEIAPQGAVVYKILSEQRRRYVYRPVVAEAAVTNRQLSGEAIDGGA